MALEGVPRDRRLARQLSRRAGLSAHVEHRRVEAHARAVARREKARADAREGLPRHVLVALVAGGASLPLEGTLGVVALVVSGVTALRAYRDVCGLRLPPLPSAAAAPPVLPPPPGPRSTAFPAVRRLETARVELARLVPLVSAVGRERADEAWQAAGEADTELRWQAARLAAVEPHRGADPTLVQALFDGVAAQERLVGAVADLVAASGDPLTRRRLQDATDALHGLAAGLREVRG